MLQASYDQVERDCKEADSQGSYNKVSSVEYYPPGHPYTRKVYGPIKNTPGTWVPLTGDELKEWACVASVPPLLVKEKEEESFLIKLIDDHWRYIEGVIQNTDAHSEKHLEEIMFHYKTAFRHGWKHHKEYVDANHN